MALGVPYKGSKNAIAKWLIDQMPPGDRFVDLFAGGCAVTHAAMLSGKYRQCLANDIGNAHILFYDAINGNLRGTNRWVSREAFMREKDTDPFVQWCYSFGNDGKSYLFSKSMERYKSLVYKVVTSDTDVERYHAYRHAITELVDIIKRGGGQCDLPSLEALKRLESFERFTRLESLGGTGATLTIQRGDYRDVELRSGDIVYCDIPYKGTNAVYTDGFDYNAFYDWCDKQSVPVFISEYNMPADMFSCVAEKTRCGHVCATNNANYVTERLYVPVHQAQ